MRYRKKSAGFSIVELLISVTLGLIILAAVTSVFVNSKQGYRVQESAGRLQENGRYAMDYLSRTIRMADFWVGITASSVSMISSGTLSAYGGPGNCKGAWLVLGDSGATTNAASTAGIVGYQGAATYPTDTSLTTTQNLPTGCFTTNPYIANSDVLVVRYANPDAYVATCQLSATACSGTSPPAATATNGDFYVRALPGKLAVLFNLSDKANALSKASGGISGDESNGILDYQYAVDIFYLGWTNYTGSSTSCSTTPTAQCIPTLNAIQMRSGTAISQPIAEGIEMMTFEYGVFNPVTNTTLFQPASAVTDWTQVVSVRATLMVRGDTLDNYQDSQSYQLTSTSAYCPSSSTTPPTGSTCIGNYKGFERYQRRLLVKEIYIPNRVRNGAIQ